jgi:hypothetical protein
MGAGTFPRIKRPGYDVKQPLTSSAEVKERIVIFYAHPTLCTARQAAN